MLLLRALWTVGVCGVVFSLFVWLYFTDFSFFFCSIKLLPRWYWELELVYRREVIRERLRGRIVGIWRGRDVGLLPGRVGKSGLLFTGVVREEGKASGEGAWEELVNI